MAQNVLVFLERRDGAIKRPSFEAIAVAARLANQVGGEVQALALGPGAAGHASEVGVRGVARLHVCEHAALETYAAEPYAAALADAARRADAAVVLAAGTAMGRDVAPRATARLGTACASDLIEVDLDADGTLHGKRPVYSGRAFARVSIRGVRPAVGTLRPNAFATAPQTGDAPAKVLGFDPSVAPEAARVRTVEVRRAQAQRLDVSEASIVVSGGRGLQDPTHFALIRGLADALGGAVGASRAVVDAGWIEHAHQVGQTGKVVSPDLYVACGISGAVQHLAGMSSSKVIVAINKDPDAPIFKIADYGIVGDLFQIVPALTEEIRKLRS
jgi:electron transfer flavoprotein alpha subunit